MFGPLVEFLKPCHLTPTFARATIRLSAKTTDSLSRARTCASRLGSILDYRWTAGRVGATQTVANRTIARESFRFLYALTSPKPSRKANRELTVSYELGVFSSSFGNITLLGAASETDDTVEGGPLWPRSGKIRGTHPAPHAR
jgi:hypothetical protein